MDSKALRRSITIIFLLILLLVSGCSRIIALSPEPSITPTLLSSPTAAPRTETAIPATETRIPPTNTAIPPSKTPHPPTATKTSIPTKTSTFPEPSANQEQPFEVVRIDPSEGSLADLLAQEVQKAEARGLLPVVYFESSW